MANKGTHLSAEHKKRISEAMVGNKNSVGCIRTEEHKKIISSLKKGKPRSEETKRKISLSKKGTPPWNKGKSFSEEARQKMSEAKRGNKCALGHTLSDDSKKRISNAIKGRHPTEETRQKLRNRMPWNKGRTGIYSEDYLKRLSDAQRGKNAWRWRGGISFEPYCPKFNRYLKERIRNMHGRKCLLCQITEEENGKKLSIHHCDYNKMQGCGKNRVWNLIPLCSRCHSKTNQNRWYWFALFYNHWALNPEITL
ncbi:MAG: NUMOD3 domain-containing DNA-binding protein [Synergistaceae bacterium]|jgi:hypothetical protein